MRNNNTTPKLNAGSMADIAFLLLIFFLVSTTIPNDKGIARMLPKKCLNKEDCIVDINERNLLRITINENGKLFVNNNTYSINDLKPILKDFIDNNGDKSCTYCKGSNVLKSSDNPNEASISLTTKRNVPFKYYIAVQNELTAAYTELRNDYAVSFYKKDFKKLTSTQQKTIKTAYPFRISEANVK